MSPPPEDPVADGVNGDDAVNVILVALYDYTAEDDDELGLQEGDEIIKLGEPDDQGTF